MTVGVDNRGLYRPSLLGRHLVDEDRTVQSPNVRLRRLPRRLPTSMTSTATDSFVVDTVWPTRLYVSTAVKGKADKTALWPHTLPFDAGGAWAIETNLIEPSEES